jgi:hypothetical protein
MLFNFLNFDAIIVVSAISLFCIFIYTFYNNIFTTGLIPCNNKFKLSLIRLSFTGGVIAKAEAPATEVTLTDEDLNSLLEYLFSQIGNSNQIPVELLESLGLYTSTVVTYLEGLGYIII